MMLKKEEKKYILISFYTEGYPYDKGIDLKKEAIIFKKIAKNYFDKVLLFNPRKLIKIHKKWAQILFDKNILKEHLESKQNINTKNENWAKLNFSLWKPHLIYYILQQKNLKENSIIIFHDINLTKYPAYKHNLKASKNLFSKSLKNKSIVCIKDSYFSLSIDCKQETILKYLGSEGKTLSHIWSGCIGLKKNKISLGFCKEWIKLTEIDFNRNQITKFDNFKDFKWHSQEQATLSILFYLWKYNIKKSNYLISIYTIVFRRISLNWNILQILKYIKNSLEFYFRVGLITAIKERILICKSNLQRK